MLQSSYALVIIRTSQTIKHGREQTKSQATVFFFPTFAQECLLHVSFTAHIAIKEGWNICCEHKSPFKSCLKYKGVSMYPNYKLS